MHPECVRCSYKSKELKVGLFFSHKIHIWWILSVLSHLLWSKTHQLCICSELYIFHKIIINNPYLTHPHTLVAVQHKPNIEPIISSCFLGSMRKYPYFYFTNCSASCKFQNWWFSSCMCNNPVLDLVGIILSYNEYTIQ